MKRAIITPAVLAGAALDELKAWLAIATPGDDAALGALLRTALETCEGFTGQMPLAQLCEEIVPATAGWQALATRPVQAVTWVEGIPETGARFAIPVEDYAIDLTADGGALFRLVRSGDADRVAVRFTAGLVANWADLPESLRHGALRLAAHHYRQRERRGAGDAAGGGRRAVAAVAADAGGMITAERVGGARLAVRLAAKARRLAQARAEARRRGARRWRLARLLWPLIAKER